MRFVKLHGICSKIGLELTESPEDPERFSSSSSGADDHRVVVGFGKVQDLDLVTGPPAVGAATCQTASLLRATDLRPRIDNARDRGDHPFVLLSLNRGHLGHREGAERKEALQAAVALPPLPRRSSSGGIPS